MANTAYSSNIYAGKIPAGTHGQHQLTNHHHSTAAVPASFVTTDTLNMGYLPPGAVVFGLTLKAASQLDSNGTPTLTLNVGVTGTAQQFMAASAAVGRAAGASADQTMTAAGRLYKNTSGAKQVITVTAQANAATAVAGTLELDLDYFIEDAVATGP